MKVDFIQNFPFLALISNSINLFEIKKYYEGLIMD